LPISAQGKIPPPCFEIFVCERTFVRHSLRVNHVQET
jgi:hypothetical protein